MNSGVKTTTLGTTIDKFSDNNIFSEFGKYRVELLGIALILISISHLQSDPYILHGLNLPTFSQPSLRFFNFPGACGVKMFFFIAGFSAYFSLFRNSDDLSFYIRKAKRMFPYYYPMVLICLLAFKIDLTIVVGNLFMVGWWLSTPENRWLQYYWFHQAIYVIYILTPIFFRILNDNRNNLLKMIFIWLLFICVGLSFRPEIKVQGVQIIPVFVTGMLLCKLNIEKIQINKIFEPILYLLGICSFIALIKFYPDCGGVFGKYQPRTSEHLLICLFVAALLLFALRTLMFINKYKNKLTVMLKQILSLLGKRALEIYLIQVFILYELYHIVSNRKISEYFEDIYTYVRPTNPGHTFSLEFILCAVIMSIVFGILYGITVDFILDKFVIFYKNLKFKLLNLYNNIIR